MTKETNGFQSPQEILNQLDIRDNMTAADFGCGGGFYSMPLAKIIPNGKVYAIDVLDEPLQAVRSQAQLEKISNIETIRGNLEKKGGSKLDDESVDLVIMRNILYQSKKKAEIIKEGTRVLKTGGQLLLVDWVKESSLIPKEGWFISKEEAQRLVEAEGLTLDRELNIDNHHYGLVFKK